MTMTTTHIDHEALTTYLMDVIDFAENWITLVEALGLDPSETTVADVLHPPPTAGETGASSEVVANA